MASEQAENPQKLSNQNSQVVGAISGGIRAFTYQLSSLYLRTPVKLFRPSRFDYMAYTRLYLSHKDIADSKLQANPAFKPERARYNFFKHSSIALLVQAVQKNGWKYIPDKVLPPLLANSFTGLVLYTTYLTMLNTHSTDYSMSLNNILEPRLADTFKAGFVAGACQSIVAAPIDAIYTRLSAAEVISQNHENLWKYGIYKLRNIGVLGVFAGFGISFIKESVGFAFYFSTFELIKSQTFNRTVETVDALKKFKHQYLGWIFTKEPTKLADERGKYQVLKSCFILVGGASAAVVLQVVQFPLSKIQKIHLSRLEALDYYNLKIPEYRTPEYNPVRWKFITNVDEFPKFCQPGITRINKAAFLIKYWTRRIIANPFLSVYYKSYMETLSIILKIQASKNLTWWQWSYKGFFRNVATTIPATSVGLLVFEIMRTRLSE